MFTYGKWGDDKKTTDNYKLGEKVSCSAMKMYQYDIIIIIPPKPLGHLQLHAAWQWNQHASNQPENEQEKVVKFLYYPGEKVIFYIM